MYTMTFSVFTISRGLYTTPIIIFLFIQKHYFDNSIKRDPINSLQTGYYLKVDLLNAEFWVLLSLFLRRFLPEAMSVIYL